MSLKISITAKSVQDDARLAFRFDCRFAFQVYRVLRKNLSIPATAIEVILTDNMVEDVNRFRGVTKEPPFTVERGLGRVTAKNLPQTEDYAKVIIVFDATNWSNDLDPDGHRQLARLWTVAHEFAHPLFRRARNLASKEWDQLGPANTGHALARRLARILAEEYRVDRLADSAVRLISKGTVDGVERPMGLWDVFGVSDRQFLMELLASGHPIWPDLVQAYRERKDDLMSMWSKVAQATQQTFTLLIHAQASADAAGAPDPLTDSEIASLFAVELYIAEPWQRFMTSLRTTPPISHIRHMPSQEAELVNVGEATLIDIWKRLGLTFKDFPNGRSEILVSAPLR